MNTEPAWADLPNARHIYAVLRDVRKQPKTWAQAQEKLGSTPEDRQRYSRLSKATEKVVWEASVSISRRDMLHRAWDAVFAAFQYAPTSPEQAISVYERNLAWHAATNATDALITWDSSADLLPLSPQGLLELLQDPYSSRGHQALLLLPYAFVREGL